MNVGVFISSHAAPSFRLKSGAAALCESALTVFVVSLLIHKDVGLHVPDELVGEKLRLLGRPQDVFPDVTHLSRNKSELL